MSEAPAKRSLSLVKDIEDDIPEEIGEPPAKAKEVEEEPKPTATDDDTITLTYADVKKMSRKEMKALIKDLGLDIDHKEFTDDEDLRDEIIDECGLEEEGENEKGSVAEVEKPGCFGLEYSDSDKECVDCLVSSDCKAAFKARKKK